MGGIHNSLLGVMRLLLLVFDWGTRDLGEKAWAEAANRLNTAT